MIDENAEEGIVYVLTNDFMPGLVKIGYTTQTIEARLRELDKTGVPWPFQCHFAIKTNRYKEIESLAHATFADHRIRENREFFQVAPERVVAALRISGASEIKTNDAAIDEDGKTIEKKQNTSTSKKRFDFCNYGIPEGAELTFTRDPNKKCVVGKNGKVLYNESEFSLSRLALKFMNDLGYNWTNIQGPAFFSYDGTVLTDLKDKFESEENDEEENGN